jgi:hypothetical protein
MAEAARFDAHDGVDARIESFLTVENFQADEVLLEPMRTAEEALLDHELEKTPDPMGLDEGAAPQDQVELRPDVLGGNTI